MKNFLILLGFFFLTNCTTVQRRSEKSNLKEGYTIDVEKVYQSDDSLFLQARSAMVPSASDTSYIITMSIYGYGGTHDYGDLYLMIGTDIKKQEWNKPQKIENLARKLVANDLIKTFGDVSPAWHEETQTILCTGKTFFSYAENSDKKEAKKGRVDIENLQEVAYAVYNKNQDNWSKVKNVVLPDKLENGDDFFCANAGCTQRVDLPNGDVLLPIRYKKDGKYVSTVIQCSYDGDSLKYEKHGTLFTISGGRGLYEPSICKYDGSYYLTMRADNSAYVSKSSDGLQYGVLKEWKFSDGTVLGSHNTQQHWISNKHGLFLVYTRKGANNDHVFRNRAPLFIGQVDPDSLFVLKETEKVIMPIPPNNGGLGNFGITYINEDESWVTASVTPKSGRKSLVQVAKVKW